MKLQSNQLFENLAKEELKNLATQEEETIAKEFKNGKKRIFSAAQFWDMQGRKKNRYSKRFAF